MRSRLALLVLLASAPAAADAGVFRGPYLGQVSGERAVLLWESPTPTTGLVRYLGRTVSSQTPATHHEVELSGLPPRTEVSYALQIDGGEVYEGAFMTAPSPDEPAQAFSFLVYGDNRSSPVQHQAVVDAMMAESSASFLVNTGDLVSRGNNESHWDTFFSIEAPMLARMPLYVAIGNHEVDGGQWDIAERLFAPPTNGSPPSTSEAFYEYTFGNTQLIFLNAEVNTLYTPDAFAGEQEEWLRQALAQAPAGVEHRFVFIHKGPYSSKSGRSGNFWLRRWLDALQEAGVDAIFSGHDHYAERGFAENGLPYVIHGGGGAPLYNHLGMRSTSDHTIMWGETRLGYAVVEVEGPRASITIKALDGSIVTAFAYGDVSAPECTEATDCGEAPTYACAGGAWSCARSSCRWRCGPGAPDVVGCTDDDECTATPCEVPAICDKPDPIVPSTWSCACVPPRDCEVAADCSGHPTPIPGCAGVWGCVDEQCEFTPNDVCPELRADVDLGAVSGSPETPGLEPGSDVDARVARQAGRVSGGDVDGASCGASAPSTLGFAFALLVLSRRRRGR